MERFTIDSEASEVEVMKAVMSCMPSYVILYEG